MDDLPHDDPDLPQYDGAHEAARFLLLRGGPAVVDASERALDEDFGDSPAATLAERKHGDAPEMSNNSKFSPSSAAKHGSSNTTNKNSSVAASGSSPSSYNHHYSRHTAGTTSGAASSGTEALLSTGEVLSKWLFNCGKTIILRDIAPVGGSARVSFSTMCSAVHYEYVATATTSQAVDRVIQSLRYATTRRVILRALLRCSSLVISDQLSSQARYSSSARTSHDGQPPEREEFVRNEEQSEDFALRYFPDDEDRMLDEAMLHSCIIIFVNVDALEVDGVLEETTVEDIAAMIRWVVHITKQKSFASLPSLAVAMACVLYANGIGPVNWKVGQELRRLVDGFRMTYSGYDDAVSTVNELHISFLGSSYHLCRQAINDLLPRIQRNLQSVSSTARTATLLHRTMVEVRSVLEWYIESVEETFHQLVRKEERSRLFLEGQWHSDFVSIQDMFHQQGEIAMFQAAWANFFAVLATEEEIIRKELEDEMRFDADYLESQVLEFIRCPHHVIHRDIWEEVLWNLCGIDDQEKQLRRDIIEKIEHRERRSLVTAAEIDRQSIGIKNVFDDYFLEDAQRRSDTRQTLEKLQNQQREDDDDDDDGEGGGGDGGRTSSSSTARIYVPLRPVSPPTERRGISVVRGAFSSSPRSEQGMMDDKNPHRRGKGGAGADLSMSLFYDESRAIADEETVSREYISHEELTMRTNFVNLVKGTVLHVQYDWSLAGTSAIGFSQLPAIKGRDLVAIASGVGKQPDRHLPPHMRSVSSNYSSSPRISPPRLAVSPTQENFLIRNQLPASFSALSGGGRAESRGVGLLTPRPPTQQNGPKVVSETTMLFTGTAPPPSSLSRASGSKTPYHHKIQSSSSTVSPHMGMSAGSRADHRRQFQPSPVTLNQIATAAALHKEQLSSGGAHYQGPTLLTRALSALEDEYFGPRSRRTAKYGKGGALLPTLPPSSTSAMRSGTAGDTMNDEGDK